MKVIKPITFTSSMLTSTTAVETVPAYNAGTTYAKDDEVNYANSIYVSLQAGNVGHQPDLTASAAWWLRKSANNKYSMFDEYVNTQTSATGPLVVTLRPAARINSLALINLTFVTSVSVVVKDGPTGPTVYNKTVELESAVITDWYMYFFEPFSLASQLILTDLPPYSDPVITITFSGGGTVSVGNCLFGTFYDLGLTQYGANAGIRDYSTKEANTFGITSLVQRAFSKRMDANLFVPKGSIRTVQRVLEDLRATPAVWIGSEDTDYEMLTVFGYYRDFNIEINYPSYSLCRLEIEGLI